MSERSSETDWGKARTSFPAGLFQPAGTYRFSVDALLLASFAARTQAVRSFVDIGTGCGVVGLALLLLDDAISQGVGIDCTPELIDAARNNAQSLGLSDRFLPLDGDISDPFTRETLGAPLPPADLVVANPPWRLLGSGRLPASAARRRALFGDRHTFPDFAATAASLLRKEGLFACIVSHDRTHDMLAAMNHTGLAPTVMQEVRNTPDARPLFSLLAAKKALHAQTKVEAPLILRCEDGSVPPESLEFCPFLR